MISMENGFCVAINWMEPLNDENKLQVDEKNKSEKYKKSLKTNNVINFKNIRYKLTALTIIIYLILN